MNRTVNRIGNIAAEIDEIDRAYRRFTDAVEGPCLEDYANDEEAYQTLEAATRRLHHATSALLDRLIAASQRQP